MNRQLWRKRVAALCLATFLATTGCAPLAKHPAREGATAEVDDKLAHNPLFRDPALGMTKMRCEFHFDDPLAYREYLKQYLLDEKNCLDKAWSHPKASISAPSGLPSLMITTQYPYDTSCGSDVRITPKVCPGSVYFQVEDSKYRGDGDKPDTYTSFQDVVLGYTIWQMQRLGFFDAEIAAEAHAGKGTPEARQLNRRLLLQEYCFMGMYLGSQYKDDAESQDFFRYFKDNTDNVIANLSQASVNGDPSEQHYLDWFRKGVDANRFVACNSWAAPASEVS